MTDIRHYDKKDNNEAESQTEEDRKNYDSRIKHHKIRVRIIVITVILLAIVGVFVVCLVKFKSTYGSYTTKNSVLRNDSGYCQYIYFGDGYLRYSRDGVSMNDFDGNVVWDKSYEINNPSIDICGDYFSIANIEGNEVYVFDKDGYVNTVTTALPIIQANVTGDGLVVTTLEDTKATYINMFNSKNEKIYSIKTTADGDGVPMSISVSDDGNLLMVAYTTIEGDGLSTSVVFYNFDEVGQNESERIVAGYDTYGDQIISHVEMLSDSAAVAFGENELSFFTVGEYPKLLCNVDLDFQIDKVFYSSEYVGLFYSKEDGSKAIRIYNSDGDEILDYEVGDSYGYFTFADSDLMMYGGSKCRLINMKGKTVFETEFEDEIVSISPVSGNDTYLVITEDYIEKILLKHGG